MAGWFKETLREWRHVPAALGIAWLFVVMSLGFGVSSDALVAGLFGGFVAGFVGNSVGRYRLDGSLWFRPVASTLSGVGAVVAGVAVVDAGGPGALPIGLPTVVIGVWLLGDGIAGFRARDSQRDVSELRPTSVYRVLDELTVAAEPLSPTEIASRCDCGERIVRDALVVLRVRGLAERRADGYVANNVYLGRGFSIHGFLRRLTRPLRALAGRGA